jgi:hypothetical protein
MTPANAFAIFTIFALNMNLVEKKKIDITHLKNAIEALQFMKRWLALETLEKKI